MTPVPLAERTRRCGRCGTCWVATHGRASRRRLWLWQQAKAHRCRFTGGAA